MTDGVRGTRQTDEANLPGERSSSSVSGMALAVGSQNPGDIRRIPIRPHSLVMLTMALAATLGIGTIAPSQDAPASALPSSANAQSEDPDLQGSLSQSLSFSRDREMETRLRGVNTAFTTGHSVEGIRGLADLLALPEPHNIQVGTTFCDVRDEATRILRQSSNDIREQFRRETEVRATAELREALANGDYAALANVASRYPYTPVALECVETLATQLSDHGRFDAVIQAATRWIDRSPAPVQAAADSPTLIALLSFAWQESGATEEVTQLASRYTIPAEEPPFRSVSPRPEPRGPEVTSHDPAVSWDVQSELNESALELLRKVLNDLSRQGVHPSLAIRPLVLADRVVWRSLTEIVCIHRISGDVLWRQPIADPTIADILDMIQRKADGNLGSRLRMQLGHRVLRNSILGQITSDGERVYCMEHSPVVESSAKPEPLPAPNNLPPLPEYTPVPQLCVVAYSLADGTVQWRTDELWGANERDAFLFGPPIPQGKHLYTLVQSEDQLLFLKMDAATGVLDGASVLGEGPRLSIDQRRMSQACPIVWNGNLAICATGAGGVAAFDVYRGQLQWGFRHPRDDVEVSPGLLQPPVDKHSWTWMEGWENPQLVQLGTNLIYASPETNWIRCLGADEGELRWEVPIAGARTIVGGDGERVIITGPNSARSLRLSDGSVEREYTTNSPVVSSAWTGSVCQLILSEGQRLDWNPASGESLVSGANTSNSPLLSKAGTLRRIHGQPENVFFRNDIVGENRLGTQVHRISMRPSDEALPTHETGPRVPTELRWKSGDAQLSLAALTDWIEEVSPEEQTIRVETALTELALALESEAGPELLVDDWLPRWALTPDQIRELTYRRLRRAMATGKTPAALQHLFHLLEQKPEEWEVDLRTAHGGQPTGDSERAVLRTIRLDAALRGAMQELHDRATPKQWTDIQAAYRDWAAQESTIRDDLARPLEQLPCLPSPTQERPLEWKTLGELARQQLELRRQSTHEEGPAAATALWRLVELHMARGDWGDAAGLIEQLQRRFGSVAVRGNQTTGELVRQFPGNSPILKRIDSDRRTAWPDRQPIVTSRESSRSSENQLAIPIRAERGAMFDHLNVTFAATGESQLRFSGLGQEKSWTLSLPGSSRNLRQFYPELRQGWAFGQFLVVQLGSELFCVSSLNAKGEPKTSRTKEVILWPSVRKNETTVMVDTLGNEDNALISHEKRPVPQVVGFVRADTEMFDAYGHRVTWLGPVSAGTLCFLQQGMLVCLETATGRELWRRYDVPAGVRTIGDDGVIVMTHDGQSTIDLLSPVDGRTLRSYQSEHRPQEWLKHWGRLALVAVGQPPQGMLLSPVANPAAAPPSKDTPANVTPELQLKMVDLAGPKTLWERSFPAGSAAFEIDEDWLGVLAADGTLSFLDLHTGETIRQSHVAVPPALTQIVTAVTERSIYVSLSSSVTESRLVAANPAPLKWRRFYVNGPVHAFDRLTGEPQWSQQIENRIFPIDQVRDIPLLIFADTWKGPSDPPSEANASTHKKGNSVQNEPTRVRYWCLDARTGQVVLDTAIENKSRVEYTIERDLTKTWVELRLGETIHRFNYAMPEEGK